MHSENQPHCMILMKNWNKSFSTKKPNLRYASLKFTVDLVFWMLFTFHNLSLLPHLVAGRKNTCHPGKVRTCWTKIGPVCKAAWNGRRIKTTHGGLEPGEGTGTIDFFFTAVIACCMMSVLVRRSQLEWLWVSCSFKDFAQWVTKSIKNHKIVNILTIVHCQDPCGFGCYLVCSWYSLS